VQDRLCDVSPCGHVVTHQHIYIYISYHDQENQLRDPSESTIATRWRYRSPLLSWLASFPTGFTIVSPETASAVAGARVHWACSHLVIRSEISQTRSHSASGKYLPVDTIGVKTAFKFSVACSRSSLSLRRMYILVSLLPCLIVGM
jgi:hypothetical protein